MKKLISTLAIMGLIFTSSPAFSQSAEGVRKCILKVTVDVAIGFDAKFVDKDIYQYEKKYVRGVTHKDIMITVGGVALVSVYTGVGIPLLPVTMTVTIMSLGIKHGYQKVKGFFSNMGRKASSGVKNHFAKKRRNKKLIANAALLDLLIDVERGYGTNLDNFAKDAGVSSDRARKKIKMYNVTGRLCKGANYTVKQLKQKAFNR